LLGASVGVVLVVAGLAIDPLVGVVVSSDSMVPTLNVGDIVLMRGVDVEPTVGTIIIFHDPNNYERPVVRRLIGYVQGYFETKGDHNPRPDGWRVPPQNLMGVCIGKIPYVGVLSLQLHGPLGVTLLILLIALITVLTAMDYVESKKCHSNKVSTSPTRYAEHYMVKRQSDQ
jgi:signal peptidase I